MEFRSDRIARRERVDQPASAALISKFILRFRLNAALFASDIIGIFAIFAAANYYRHDTVFAPAGLQIITAIIPLYIAIALNRQVFGGVIFADWKSAAWRAATSFMFAVAALLFIVFYLQASQTLSREVFGLGMVGSLLFLTGSRFLARIISRRLLGQEPYTQILIRDGVELPCSDRTMVVNAEDLALSPDLRDPHALDRLGRLLGRADRVAVACPEERREAWAAALKGAHIQGEIITPELRPLRSLGAGTFEGEATLVVSIPSLSTSNRAIKRGLDLALAGGALLVLAPLMLLTALAVKLESPGPVLFIQPRLGRGNRLFPMYKFRSMRADTCDAAGNISTARNDKRVTRVGRIIRATSIDELPQLLNVLTGDMSIVGPRPHALGSLAGDKLFWEVDSRYWHRHATKPGITGLAQVRGFRGATHAQADLLGRLQSDLEYLNGWSVWRDISILLATVRVVLHRNAY